MPQAFATEAERDAFLTEPRLAILMTNRAGEAPVGVPVWFEWTGSEVLMFSARGVPKLERIEADPKVMVLVTNRVGEPEAWVSFEGEIEICEGEDPWPLVERMAQRYWDVEAMSDTLRMWEAGKSMMVMLRLQPSRTKNGR
jgi:nitroimidazol reductase NimA-like FMN-containing flavoprotein (pyridoxamine 5'-phosphate oxidase superfamily)